MSLHILNIFLHKFVLVSTSVVYKYAKVGGHANTTGHYDGILGYIQNDVADYAFKEMRLDHVVGYPFIVGPAIAASDARIVSMKPNTTNLDVDITDIVYSMSKEAYICEAVVLITVTAILILITVTNTPKQRKFSDVVRLVCRKASDFAFNIVELILDQENFQSDNESQKVLWTSLSIATFVVVFGYICNSMSTDLVAERPVKNIDYLSDLLTAKFKHVMPVMWNDMPLMGYMLLRPNHTPEYQVALKSVDNNYTVNGPGDRFTELVNIAKNGGAAGIMTEFIWYYALKVVGCLETPKDVKRVHVSKTSFGNGLLSVIFNRRLNPNLLKAAHYRIATTVETGLVEYGLLHATFEVFESQTGAELDVSFLKCMDIVTKYEPVLKDFSLDNFARTFRILAFGAGFATLFLFFELLAWYVHLILLSQRKIFRKHAHVSQSLNNGRNIRVVPIKVIKRN